MDDVVVLDKKCKLICVINLALIHFRFIRMKNPPSFTSGRTPGALVLCVQLSVATILSVIAASVAHRSVSFERQDLFARLFDKRTDKNMFQLAKASWPFACLAVGLLVLSTLGPVHAAGRPLDQHDNDKSLSSLADTIRSTQAETRTGSERSVLELQVSAL